LAEVVAEEVDVGVGVDVEVGSGVVEVVEEEVDSRVPEAGGEEEEDEGEEGA
jgi:hypothetical protein